MKALRQSTDGFYIAEEDLKTRGPGELSGTLQAGALEFRIADLSKDSELLDFARADIIKQHTLPDGGHEQGAAILQQHAFQSGGYALL